METQEATNEPRPQLAASADHELESCRLARGELLLRHR